MDTQQPTANPPNPPPSSPTEPPVPSPPVEPPPTSASPINPPPTPNPPPATHNLQPTTHFPRFAPLLLIPLILATFATSYFFFSNQRQPKPQSRASEPTLSIVLPTTNLQPTTDNFASPSSTLSPTTYNPQPTTISSSGFGTLLPSPSPLPPPPENLPPATFNIVAANDTFTPNQLTAQRGQIVTIHISASDKTYDVSIPALGLSRIISKGDRKSLEFQASTFGQYVFACASYCNTATAHGILTIKP